MTLDQQLLALEKQFWKGDADFYRSHLTEDALMAFSAIGVLSREKVLQTIASGPRWGDVDTDDVRILCPTNDTAVLSYQATARREGDDSPYVARVASVYVQRAGAWWLAFHQQTPESGA